MPRRKKSLRHYNPPLGRKLRNGTAPAPWHAVLFPLVDTLDDARLFALGRAPEVTGNGSAASEPIDQNSVAMLILHPVIVRKIFGMSSAISAEASFDDTPQPLRHDLAMAWNGETPEYKKECGDRLRRARLAVGYESLRAFAFDTQTDEDNLGNWERGVAQAPPSYISLLKRTFGITHAWIYDEDAANLPDKVRQKLLTKDRRKHA